MKDTLDDNVVQLVINKFQLLQEELGDFVFDYMGEVVSYEKVVKGEVKIEEIRDELMRIKASAHSPVHDDMISSHIQALRDFASRELYPDVGGSKLSDEARNLYYDSEHIISRLERAKPENVSIPRGYVLVLNRKDDLILNATIFREDGGSYRELTSGYEVKDKEGLKRVGNQVIGS